MKNDPCSKYRRVLFASRTTGTIRRMWSRFPSVASALLSTISSSPMAEAAETSVETPAQPSVAPPAESVGAGSAADSELDSSDADSASNSDNPWEAERLRRRIGVGGDLGLLSGQSRTYTAAAVHIEYRFSPLVSVEASLVPSAVEPQAYRNIVLIYRDCDVNTEHHAWRGTALLKLHPNGVRNFDPWFGAEAGVLDRVTTDVTTCTGRQTRTEQREHFLMPAAGLAAGASYWIHDATSFDVHLRALATASSGMAVWMSGGFGLSFHFGVL